MSIPKEVCTEVRLLTEALIAIGLSVQQNYPYYDSKKGIVQWDGFSDVSIALKNVSYLDKYSAIDLNRNYNIKLLDSALIQMSYMFDRDSFITSHRLAYFPYPLIERYDENENQYDSEYYGGSEFHDVIDPIDGVKDNRVTFPFRFDFAPKDFRDVWHSKSHLHLGEFENCRIPVSVPLTPFHFVHFIIRSFYSAKLEEFLEKAAPREILFDRCISENEESIMHIEVGRNS